MFDIPLIINLFISIVYNEWQRMTTSGTTNDNEWQKMTMSDKEWQQVIKRMKTNESKYNYYQKQPFADDFRNKFSQKISNVHRKTPVLEHLFNKVAVLKNITDGCFCTIYLLGILWHI